VLTKRQNGVFKLQNELPAEAVELQEEARQEKKSQGGYRCVTLLIVLWGVPCSLHSVIKHCHA
jgi:hypothetical protein